MLCYGYKLDQVCSHSITSLSKSANIYPLKLNDLKEKGYYKRGEDKLGSTEFTFSRFLVPILNNYKGWALFCDCDRSQSQNNAHPL